ncbi:MAG: PH domain-containing protein [Pseudomonadota bacterium]
MPEEKILWSGAVSQWTNLGAYVLAALLTLSVILSPIGIGLAVWKYLVTKNHRYELTSQRLKTYSGVLSKKVEDLELYRVKDSSFEQPFWLRLFGLGNVVIVTADASAPMQAIHAVPGAYALRETLRGAVEECRDRKRVRNIETE